MKYHISADGIARVCNAEGVCPLGGEESHYPTVEEANRASQQALESEYGVFGEPYENISELDDLEQYIDAAADDIEFEYPSDEYEDAVDEEQFVRDVIKNIRIDKDTGRFTLSKNPLTTETTGIVDHWEEGDRVTPGSAVERTGRDNGEDSEFYDMNAEAVSEYLEEYYTSNPDVKYGSKYGLGKPGMLAAMQNRGS